MTGDKDVTAMFMSDMIGDGTNYNLFLLPDGLSGALYLQNTDEVKLVAERRSFPAHTEITVVSGTAEGWYLESWHRDFYGVEKSKTFTLNGDMFIGVTYKENTDGPDDIDDDAMLDSWEIANRLDITLDDSADDPDSDNLLNLYEYERGTDPHLDDTDGDNLPDGWEVNSGLDPNDATGDNGANGDPDRDGFMNSEEMLKATTPQRFNWGRSITH